MQTKDYVISQQQGHLLSNNIQNSLVTKEQQPPITKWRCCWPDCYKYVTVKKLREKQYKKVNGKSTTTQIPGFYSGPWKMDPEGKKTKAVIPSMFEALEHDLYEGWEGVYEYETIYEPEHQVSELTMHYTPLTTTSIAKLKYENLNQNSDSKKTSVQIPAATTQAVSAYQWKFLDGNKIGIFDEDQNFWCFEHFEIKEFCPKPELPIMQPPPQIIIPKEALQNEDIRNIQQENHDLRAKLREWQENMHAQMFELHKQMMLLSQTQVQNSQQQQQKQKQQASSPQIISNGVKKMDESLQLPQQVNLEVEAQNTRLVIKCEQLQAMNQKLKLKMEQYKQKAIQYKQQLDGNIVIQKENQVLKDQCDKLNMQNARLFKQKSQQVIKDNFEKVITGIRHHQDTNSQSGIIGILTNNNNY